MGPQPAPPERIERLTELVLVQLPGRLAPVRDAVVASVTSAVAAAAVLRHLEADGTALVSGSSCAPPPVARLIRVLRGSGRPAVTPRCASCDKGRSLPYEVPGGRICYGCYMRRNAATCATCGNVRPVFTRNADGRPICGQCHKLANAEPCRNCGDLRPVAVRGPDGPLCQHCWQRPTHLCVRCGTLAPAHAFGPDGPVCDRCYRPGKRRCGICGRIETITVAATSDAPDICQRCYEKPLPPCPDCGLRDPCEHDRGFLAQPGHETVCLDPIALAKRRRTPARPIHECSVCGRRRPTQAVWPRGPVCSGCYDAVLTHPSACRTCGDVSALVGVDTCAACSGATRSYHCAECGTPCRPVEDGRCPRCVARRDLRRLLAAAPKQSTLHNLVRIADETDSPAALYQWLRRGPSATWIRTLAEIGGAEIKHADLDVLVTGKRGIYLRHLLMTVGILPQRNEYTEGLTTWLAGALTDEHAESHIVRRFARWSVLRRARRRRRAATENSARWARQQVLVARDFCGWLERHGQTLATCRQADIDLWLATGGTRAYTVRYLIAWATRQGVCDQRLTVPMRRTLKATTPIGDVERWAMLTRLLTDDQVPADVRVAGTLVLLFGQHVSRMVALSVTAVDMTAARPTITLGRTPIALPDLLRGPLARLLEDAQRGHASIHRTADARTWLFPGGQPGQHVGSEYMRTRLSEHGIIARAARNTALAEFAQDLPAEVLASTLGMHVNTAVAWRAQLQADYTDYLAARHARPSRQT